jgi:hypothetical protein
MELDPKLIREVSDFVAEKTGYPPEKIAPETMLAYDIGLAGDDAWGLFEAFAKRFTIAPESFRGFDWVRQFGNEGWPLWPPPWPAMLALLLFFLPPFGWIILYWWFKKKSREEHDQHKDDPDAIRIQDLVEAAAAKRWMKRNQAPNSLNRLREC